MWFWLVLSRWVKYTKTSGHKKKAVSSVLVFSRPPNRSNMRFSRVHRLPITKIAWGKLITPHMCFVSAITRYLGPSHAKIEKHPWCQHSEKVWIWGQNRCARVMQCVFLYRMTFPCDPVKFKPIHSSAKRKKHQLSTVLCVTKYHSFVFSHLWGWRYSIYCWYNNSCKTFYVYWCGEGVAVLLLF